MHTVPHTHGSKTPAPVPSPGPALPPRIGPYAVGAVLGRGGMSDVHRAVHAATGARVALKVLRPLRSGRRASFDCFENEVAVMGALDHPNIVGLLDKGVDADTGLLWVAMPLVKGRSLRQLLIETRALPPRVRELFVQRRLLHVFLQLCDAVAHAHGQGILHRDLKPANVLVDTMDRVHLLDWGVSCPIAPAETRARLLAQRPEANRRSRPRFGGTPGYMSPEQIREHPFTQDESSDVWSLGAILFELLDFRRLVAGTTSTELLGRTLSGELRRPTSEDRLAVLLLPIIDRATALAPADRYPSVAELAEDVRRVRSAAPAPRTTDITAA